MDQTQSEVYLELLNQYYYGLDIIRLRPYFLTNMKNKIKEQIVGAVESYRRAAFNLKSVTVTTPRWEQACHMMMDRAAGALDVLWILDPTNAAWKTTGWTN